MRQAATRGETYMLFASVVAIVTVTAWAIDMHSTNTERKRTDSQVGVNYLNAANTAYNLRLDCLRAIRRDVIARDEAWHGFQGAQAVSEDPFQSARTRGVRRREARYHYNAAQRIEDRMPDAQRIVPRHRLTPEYSCTRNFPLPLRPPGV